MTRLAILIKEASSVLRMPLEGEVYVGESPETYPLFSIHPDKFWGKLLEWRYLRDYRAPQKRVELHIEPIKNPEGWLKEAHFLEFENLLEYSLISSDQWGALKIEELGELDRREKHLRAELLRVIEGMGDLKSLYDCQCSTGTCIYEIASVFPNVRCFASDLRQEMVIRTKKVCSSLKNVEVFQHNATELFFNKVDVMVLRGLGVQVVTREEALQIIRNTHRALKIRGLVIIPAVAPLQINRRDLDEEGFYVLSTSAWNDQLKVRFPFVVAQKARRPKRSILCR